MRIFVGSLALTITAAELRQVFTPYGRVASVQILQERETSRSRGFGFVEMPSAPEAQAALEGLNGRALEGRLLTVHEARQWGQQGGPRRPWW
jgi:RNA recognition motif-containing protein